METTHNTKMKISEAIVASMIIVGTVGTIAVCFAASDLLRALRDKFTGRS